MPLLLSRCSIYTYKKNDECLYATEFFILCRKRLAQEIADTSSQEDIIKVCFSYACGHTVITDF